jgi:hypothetical protein
MESGVPMLSEGTGPESPHFRARYPSTCWRSDVERAFENTIVSKIKPVFLSMFVPGEQEMPYLENPKFPLVAPPVAAVPFRKGVLLEPLRTLDTRKGVATVIGIAEPIVAFRYIFTKLMLLSRPSATIRVVLLKSN